jgi:hypothetical protein
MVGPMNTAGRVPEDWLAESATITRRTWKWREFEGADVRGELRNGNRWRYFARCGDFLLYFDVPAKAAAYFDRIVDGAFMPKGR